MLRKGAAVRARSTSRWDLARGLASGSGLSTEEDDRSTMCSTPAVVASLTKASMCDASAYRKTEVMPARAAVSRGR